jgi:hypothetical protein
MAISSKDSDRRCGRLSDSGGALVNERGIACLVAGLGTAVYFALAFGMSSVVGADRFGTFAYNYYFLALIDGRFDVPLRVITLEGAFDTSGRAFIYYGMAPLITRAIAWPFVDLTAVSLAPLTIFLAAAGGTAIYHLVLVQTLARYGPEDAALRRSVGLLLGVMIWFASPGLLLVANTAIYHEPTAMAYLFMACFLGLLAQVVLFEKPIGSVLLPLAVFAGLSVYGRPHLAVGLYAGVCLLSLVLLWQKGWRGLPRAAGAMAILFFFGAALLAFNELRFGNMLQMQRPWGGACGHFLGNRKPRLPANERVRRARTIQRLSHCAQSDALSLRHARRSLERRPRTGLPIHDVKSRLHQDRHPRVGMVFYWLPWFMLALAGVRGGSAGLRHAWAPVLATGIGALMMASYGTVTLRYRFDLWPFLMVGNAEPANGPASPECRPELRGCRSEDPSPCPAGQSDRHAGGHLPLFVQVRRIRAVLAVVL